MSRIASLPHDELALICMGRADCGLRDENPRRLTGYPPLAKSTSKSVRGADCGLQPKGPSRLTGNAVAVRLRILIWQKTRVWPIPFPEALEREGEPPIARALSAGRISWLMSFELLMVSRYGPDATTCPDLHDQSEARIFDARRPTTKKSPPTARASTRRT
jgi:hypothetical protein